MATMTERNVKGLYDGSAIDDISVKLHSDAGYEVVFNVWEDEDHEYHVFADTDTATEDFLQEHYPDELPGYLQHVESICTASSKHLSLINSFISANTYNRIRPLIQDENNWLELNEEELYRD